MVRRSASATSPSVVDASCEHLAEPCDDPDDERVAHGERAAVVGADRGGPAVLEHVDAFELGGGEAPVDDVLAVLLDEGVGDGGSRVVEQLGGDGLLDDELEARGAAAALAGDDGAGGAVLRFGEGDAALGVAVDVAVGGDARVVLGALEVVPGAAA
jgi:hypothetical protein